VQVLLPLFYFEIVYFYLMRRCVLSFFLFFSKFTIMFTFSLSFSFASS
jgi:hypothetical protein